LLATASMPHAKHQMARRMLVFGDSQSWPGLFARVTCLITTATATSMRALAVLARGLRSG
jgi:hypothetical protein